MTGKAPTTTMDSMGGERRATAAHEFDDLYLTHVAAVTRTVFFVVRDRARAEEIAQDAFVTLLRHWSKVSRYDRPDLWVRRVAVRDAVRDQQREQRRTVLHRVATTGPEVDGPETAVGLHAELVAHLQRLPVQQRAAIVLFYLEDRPMDEIAEIMGCAPSTAWNHLRTARQRLAAAMGEPEVADDVR